MCRDQILMTPLIVYGQSPPQVDCRWFLILIDALHFNPKHGITRTELQQEAKLQCAGSTNSAPPDVA